MSDEINKKVIDIFKAHKKDAKHNKKGTVKNFNGVSYVKLSKDLNGNPFQKNALLEYSQTCRYIVRVMRELDNQVFLYNYDIASDELFDFLNRFKVGSLNGKIIEIDKYNTEDLA